MLYIKDIKDIVKAISIYAQSQILWIDTEVADFLTRKPRLSLIQVLAKPINNPEYVTILDVLNQPEAIDIFVEKIMSNPAIIKVFHNASYDLKYLGNQAKNVTCTLEMAKKIPHYLLPLPNLSLKTLAEALCNVPQVDKSQQTSNWGQRPLTETQLNYAGMDTVYLAMVYQQLLQLTENLHPDPKHENLMILTERYLELKKQLQLIDSEFTHIETRLKNAMQAQNVTEINDLQLSQSNRKTIKVDFFELAKVSQEHDIKLDLAIALTQKLQKELKDVINQLSLQTEISTSWRLTAKKQDDVDDQL